jgi:hypothetical protein
MDGTGGRTWQRVGMLAAAVTAIAGLAVACGGNGNSPALSGTANYQKALAYAQCMRAHGEPSYPDPTSNGGFIIDGRKDHLNGQLMQSANETCQHLLPKTPPMTAARQKQVTAEALKYVACMRTHGIPDMPDPVVNAQGVEFRIGTGTSKGGPVSAMVQNAMHACQKLLPFGPP